MGRRKLTDAEKLKAARERVEYLTYEVKRLETKVNTIDADRDQFRAFLVEELRNQIRVHGRNEYFGPAAMIERIAKFMGRVQTWSWG